jgi:3-oxoacyl-[acyl-carrier protein] reductase
LICDIVADRIADAAHELRQYGEVHAQPGDVTEAVFCTALVERAREVFGGLDVLVNNAGIGIFEPFLEHSEATWDRPSARPRPREP